MHTTDFRNRDAQAKGVLEWVGARGGSTAATAFDEGGWF
jgi:hypothetical protein